MDPALRLAILSLVGFLFGYLWTLCLISLVVVTVIRYLLPPTEGCRCVDCRRLP